MKSTFFVIISILIGACAPLKKVVKLDAKEDTLPAGSSGMAQVNENSFLAVYDLKNFQKGTRLGLIKTYADSIKVHAVIVKDWVSEEGIPSDLEAITKIPNRENEYLISESGNWQGKLGRIFHIKLMPEALEAKVLGVVKIPIRSKNDIGLVGDQYEGILCYASNSKELYIILGERGGSDVHSSGKLQWGEISLSDYTLNSSETGFAGMDVNAPGDWTDNSKRDITDLFLDEEGNIWASASQDRGDSGPFYSVIYELGSLSGSKINPLKLNETFSVYKALPGYKIEALSGPSSSAPLSKFSFGTEDEIYGGTWRPIE